MQLTNLKLPHTVRSTSGNFVFYPYCHSSFLKTALIVLSVVLIALSSESIFLLLLDVFFLACLFTAQVAQYLLYISNPGGHDGDKDDNYYGGGGFYSHPCK